MNFEDYRSFDALGLAALVKAGEVSANELLNAAIARAEAVNPRINAIVTPLYDWAKEHLAQVPTEGDFAGVPFLLKDLLSALAGTPMSSGSAALRHFIPTHDSHLVGRYRQAGVVIFGKTNTPEFGLMGVTEPRAFGPARNPWNLDHTPGGSSGGSAAAVAAGIVPMAGGGDGGGSIRIPAACCGLFGLKPTRGRVSSGPDAADYWDGAAVEHVITRSVRDSAAMLDNICGPAIGDPYWVSKPSVPFRTAVEQPEAKFRIAYSTASPLGKPIDPEARRAVEDAVKKLAALGHDVIEDSPDIDGNAVASCYLTIYLGHVAGNVRQIETLYGKKAARQGVEPMTREIAHLGRALSAEAYVASRLKWNDFGRAMGRFHQQYDFYLTPTLAAPPVPIGSLGPSAMELTALNIVNRLKLGKFVINAGLIDRMAADSLEKMPFTQLANLTGQPSMSVPLYWCENGLPLGVQFTAAMNDEARLFQLAAQLEQAYPWKDRWAPLA